MVGKRGVSCPQETLTTLLGVAEQGLMAVAADGTVTFANRSALRLLGEPGEDVIGGPYGALRASELAGRIEHALAAEKGATGSFTFEFEERTLACRITRLRSDGSLTITLTDQTELAVERDRNAAVLSATADGLVLLSRDDVVTYVNPAACTMLHTSPRKIVGKKVSIDTLLGVEADGTPAKNEGCWEFKKCNQVTCPAYQADDLRCWLISGTLCHPGEEPCVFAKKREECDECDYHQAHAEAYDPLDPHAVSEVELSSDGGLVVKVRVSAVVDSDGDYIGRVVALRDITAEREIADMKNEFVSTVSHELRTPLTSIKGYVDLILDGAAGEVNEIQNEFLGIVKENSDRLVELINEMLDISRIESGRVHFKIEPMDLRDSIVGAVDTFRAVLSQTDRSVDIEVPDGLPSVDADRDRVGQVLINFISNALKYSPGGGRVRISAGMNADGDKIIVSVHDEGLGISREDQKRLFTKFYRVDSALTREIGGTGLGLSICKNIIELLGGEVGVKSKLGHGSTFWFSLPVSETEFVRTPKLQPPDKVDGKVLVVDRNPEVSGLIEKYLVDRGYSVVKAHNPDEALKVALKERPRVITLDVIMEGTEGFDLLQRLKERPETADIPVVVLSIVCDEGRSCRLGAANYLEKPIDKTRLLSIIDDIVGSVDSPKALVVDDDPGVVRVLADTLRQNGFAVAAAYDGTEAIASIERRIPDIVISDLKMPKMDGYQLIQRIKTTPEWADIPVIIMTGYRIDRSRVDVIDLAVTSLRKPFSAQAIADEVIALLERERLGATQ